MSGDLNASAVPHENVHIWQGRVFGDTFFKKYLTWQVGGSVAGAAYAAYSGDNVADSMDAAGYTNNPFETQAFLSNSDPYNSYDSDSSLQWWRK